MRNSACTRSRYGFSRSDHHDRKFEFLAGVEIAVIDGKDDDAVHALRNQSLQRLRLAPVRTFGIHQKDLAPPPLGFLKHRLHQCCEERVFYVRNDQPDDIRAADLHGARGAVLPVARRLAARRTFFRTSSLIDPRSLRTYETVAIETPASLATSRTVIRDRCLGFKGFRRPWASSGSRSGRSYVTETPDRIPDRTGPFASTCPHSARRSVARAGEFPRAWKKVRVEAIGARDHASRNCIPTFVPRGQNVAVTPSVTVRGKPIKYRSSAVAAVRPPMTPNSGSDEVAPVTEPMKDSSSRLSILS